MKGRKGFTATILLLTGFLLATVFLTVRVLKYESGRTEYRYLQDQFGLFEGPLQAGADYSDHTKPPRDGTDQKREDMEEWSELMISRNPDYVFWIRIPGTKISYPVVKNTIPGYYLNHTFSGSENPCGSIFCRGESAILGDNPVLYGHNMKDGSMFADLKRYLDKTYFQNHPDIWIYRRNERLHYKVYNCRIVSGKEVNMSRRSLPDDEEKQSCLTLSTCFGKEKRVIVQAVLLCYTE